MRPSHRLDLVVVPADPDVAPVGRVQSLWADLVKREVIASDGRAAANAGGWLGGGFRSMRIDRPDGVALYANRQGGFTVACPSTDAVVTEGFGRAMTAWRQGGERSLCCASCGEIHALERLRGQPPIALASLAVILADANVAALSTLARHDLQKALGPLRLVLRRG